MRKPITTRLDSNMLAELKAAAAIDRLTVEQIIGWSVARWLLARADSLGLESPVARAELARLDSDAARRLTRAELLRRAPKSEGLGSRVPRRLRNARKSDDGIIRTRSA